MEIKKEFAPITIRINTIQELADFKALSRAALDSDRIMGRISVRYQHNNKPGWVLLAEELQRL